MTHKHLVSKTTLLGAIHKLCGHAVGEEGVTKYVFLFSKMIFLKFVIILSFSDVSLRLAAMASLALLRFQSKLPTSYSRQFQMYTKLEK